MKSEEHYYKNADVEYASELERKKYEYLNDYGYNYDCVKRKGYDLDRYAETLKNGVNHIDINVKR